MPAIEVYVLDGASVAFGGCLPYLPLMQVAVVQPEARQAVSSFITNLIFIMVLLAMMRHDCALDVTRQTAPLIHAQLQITRFAAVLPSLGSMQQLSSFASLDSC